MTFFILYFKASGDVTTQVLNYNVNSKSAKCLITAKSPIQIIQLFW